jgi:ribonuclease HI
VNDIVTVATDGACSGNPGPTGWAWVGEDGTWAAGSLVVGTNQVGELLGLLHAIDDHADVALLTVLCDSAYAIGTYTAWMDAHAERGWVGSSGRPTANQPIVAALRDARDRRRTAGLPPVRLVKVKGHAGHLLNSWADERAVRAARHGAEGVARAWRGSGLPVGTLPARADQDRAGVRR